MVNPYREAGVDVDSGYRVSKFIKQNTNNKNIGNFGGVYEIPEGYKHPVLISGNDGVGTKLLLTTEAKKWDTIGIDCIAMCVNDILAQGAIPQYFLDYISTGKIDEKIEEILIGVMKGCDQANIDLIGGETAEMPGVYGNDDYDIAGFSVGICEKNDLLNKNDLKSGDVLIGLKSNGIHSNGFSLVRKILFQDHNFTINSILPELPGVTLGELLLIPTKIYVSDIVPLLERKIVKGISHITGGGFFENIPRMLPDKLMAEINVDIWPDLTIFNILQKYGKISTLDMYHIFNMGIGMVIAVDESKEIEVLDLLNETETMAYTIGELKTKESVSLNLKGDKLCE